MSRHIFDREGRDIYGRDAEGYGLDGHNKAGLDRYGFNRAGVYVATDSKRDPEGFNYYGVDENGQTREGKTHEAVALAQQLLLDPEMTMEDFAKANGLTERQLGQKLVLAKKVLPSLEGLLTDRGNALSNKTWALVRKDVELLETGELNFKEFWDRYVRLKFDGFVRAIGAELITDLILRELDGKFDPKKPEQIHVLACATNSRYYSELSKRLGFLKQMLQMCKKSSEVVKMRCELAKMLRGVNNYRDSRVYLLKSESFSLDGGETMIKITDEDIEKAKTEIYARRGLVCYRTVRQEIVATYR